MSVETLSPMASVSHISLMNRPFGAPRIHMDENASSAPAITSTPLPADAPASFDSAEGAARYLLSVKDRKPEPAESAEPATAENELASQEDNTAPHEEAHGEDQVADPAEVPPIERPKSWTEAEDAEWQATPRALQQKIVARELERDTALRRTQNDAAEKLRGLTAKEQQAEQARKSYEARQADYTKALENALQADFGDIQSLQDVRNLQANDPFRFQAWQVRQMELSSAQAEKQQVDQRKAQAKQDDAKELKSREHSLLIEKAPEFADASKLDAAQKSAAKLFRDSGFTDDQLATIIDDNPVLDDHRMQLIINDADKYRKLMAAKTAVSAKPLPPVQRPGTARPQGQAQSEQIQTLTRQLNETGDLKIAQQLRALQSRTRRVS